MARILNRDEVNRFQELQEYFAVGATAKRLDDFAKWVFSTVTLVATLGTGCAMFSNQSLRAEAKVVLDIAMVLVGLSLGCAVMVLAPAFPQINLGYFSVGGTGASAGGVWGFILFMRASMVELCRLLVLANSAFD